MSNPFASVVLLASATTLAVFALHATVHAEQTSTPADRKHSRDLKDSPPADDIDRELFGQGDKQPRAGQGGQQADDLEEQLQRELGSAAHSKSEEPLLSVARQMHEAKRLIHGQDAGQRTRDLQNQIVAQLDQLIQQARQQGSQLKSGSNPSSQASPGPNSTSQPQSKPDANTSSANKPSTPPNSAPKQDPVPGATPSPGQTRDIMARLWGELPKHERGPTPTPPHEEFLPKYEIMIQDYFRRLADQSSPSP